MRGISTHKILNNFYFGSVILKQLGILISVSLKWPIPTHTTIVNRKLRAFNTVPQKLRLTNMPKVVTSGWKLHYRPKATWVRRYNKHEHYVSYCLDKINCGSQFHLTSHIMIKCFGFIEHGWRNINTGKYRKNCYVTVVSRAKVTSLSWIGQKLCYSCG